MADEINPLTQMLAFWPLILIFIIVIVIVLFFIQRRKPKELEYNPQPLKKTLKEYLDDKLGFMGRNIHGNMYIGMQRVAIPRRMARVIGKFCYMDYDYKTKQMSLKMKDGKVDSFPYDLYIIESLSNNFLIRTITLGLLGRYKIVLRNNADAIMIDGDNIKLPEGMDMNLYGKVWANSYEAWKYLNDISMGRLLEQTQMHVENVPDKFIAIEMHQAKREKTMEAHVREKKKMYKEQEDAADSDVEA